MIENVSLKNFTIFKEFVWKDVSNVNLVIGENDTGKSNLLRLLYAVSRSLQDFVRLDNEAPAGRWEDVLAEKLRWTFQPPDLELGKIVRKGKENRLRVWCEFESAGPIIFSFTPSAKKNIRDADFSQIGGPFVRTLFFPPKEVLTTFRAIAATREQQQIIGFGDTYYDLVMALRQPPSHSSEESSLGHVRNELEDLFPGKVRQREDGTFEYRRGPGRYDMTQTAEGIKKIGILTHLIRNRSIQPGSILFFDEPAANLHPKATIKLVEMLYELSKANIQLFIATHSYTVLKQFELLAREHQKKVPLCVLSPTDEGVDAEFADLQERIPENSIVDASVDLFNHDLAIGLEA